MPDLPGKRRLVGRIDILVCHFESSKLFVRQEYLTSPEKDALWGG